MNLARDKIKKHGKIKGMKNPPLTMEIIMQLLSALQEQGICCNEYVWV